MGRTSAGSRVPFPLLVLLGLVFAALSYLDMGGWSVYAGLHSVESGVVWAAALWLAFRITRMHPVGTAGPMALLYHFGAVLGLVVADHVATDVFDLLASRAGHAALVGATWRVVHSAALSIGYSFFAGVAHLRESIRRERERRLESIQLEVELARSEAREARESLRALRLELNPQFLLNGLEGAETLVERDAAGAQRILVRLGDLLRRTLLDREGRQVYLDEELELLAEFIALEEDRLGTEVAVEQRVDEEALEGLVPEMILQPLMELAMDRTAVTGGAVVVGGERQGDGLRLYIEAPAPAPSHRTRAEADGLRNVRERLRRYYGPAARLEVEAGARWRATLELPWREEPAPPRPGGDRVSEAVAADPALARARDAGTPDPEPAGMAAGGVETALWRTAGWMACVAWFVTLAAVSYSGWRLRSMTTGGLVPPGTAAAAAAWVGVVGTVFAVLAFRAALRFPVDRDHPDRFLAHLIIAPVLAVATYVATLVPLLFIDYVRTAPLIDSVLAGSRGLVVLYLVLFTIAHAVEYARRSRDRELRAALLEADLARSELREARVALRALRLELNPHFLLNGLNGAVALVPEDPAAAREMLGRLGAMMRRVLHDVETEEVLLAEEMALLREFLAAHEGRLREPVEIVWKVEDAVRDARVPAMILQPLVENAIKHGLVPTGRGGRIVVAGGRVDDRLELLVEDDGVGPGRSGAEGTGVGVRNVRERLRRHYGEEASLTLEQVSGGGTCARLSLPWREGLDLREGSGPAGGGAGGW